MDRAWETNPSQNPPAPPNPPTLGYPSETNPATTPGAWWWHMITEEIRTVIVAAGIAPDATKVNQLAAAIQAIAAAAAAAITTSGSFTATLSGLWSANPTGTMKWTKSGSLVTLYVDQLNLEVVTANSGAFFTIEGIPGNLAPSAERAGLCDAVISGGVVLPGRFVMFPNGTCNIAPLSGNFSQGQSDGIAATWMITYNL